MGEITSSALSTLSPIRAHLCAVRTRPLFFRLGNLLCFWDLALSEISRLSCCWMRSLMCIILLRLLPHLLNYPQWVDMHAVRVVWLAEGQWLLLLAHRLSIIMEKKTNHFKDLVLERRAGNDHQQDRPLGPDHCYFSQSRRRRCYCYVR